MTRSDRESAAAAAMVAGRISDGRGADAYKVSLLDSSEVDRNAGFRDAWQRLSETSNSPDAFYHSPAWWDYTRRADERSGVFGVTAADGSLAGAVPASVVNFPLLFQVGSRVLGKMNVRAVRLMPGQLVLPDEEEVYGQLIGAALAAWPECDCLVTNSVVVDSYFWRTISKSLAIRRQVGVYLPYGRRAFHSIVLPGSFQEYTAKFKSKGRYNLNRQVRLLREHGEGQLELVRVEQATGVKWFLAEAMRVSARTWQNQVHGPQMSDSRDEVAKYEQLANQGVLRCYLLRCGGETCVFLRAFQHGSQFYFDRMGFDERFARFSPGSVLLHLVIEDLCNYRPARRLSFLWGSDWFKEHLATEHSEDACVLLIRRRLLSRLRVTPHRAFTWGIRVAKGVLRGRR